MFKLKWSVHNWFDKPERVSEVMQMTETKVSNYMFNVEWRKYLCFGVTAVKEFRIAAGHWRKRIKFGVVDVAADHIDESSGMEKCKAVNCPSVEGKVKKWSKTPTKDWCLQYVVDTGNTIVTDTD